MDELDIKQQENLYKEYIDNHRQNVQKAWDSIKANTVCMDIICKSLNTNIEAAISLIDDMIKNHDISKYDKFEFDAYRKNFYPVNLEEKEANMENFNNAWKYHYSNNLHHWNWWYETGNKDNMKLPYVVEMICDWMAMGYKFGNTAKQWYEKNKTEIQLGNVQRTFVEKILNIIYA